MSISSSLPGARLVGDTLSMRISLNNKNNNNNLSNFLVCLFYLFTMPVQLLCIQSTFRSSFRFLAPLFVEPSVSQSIFFLLVHPAFFLFSFCLFFRPYCFLSSVLSPVHPASFRRSVCSLVRSFVRAIVRSFVRSFVGWLVRFFGFQ